MAEILKLSQILNPEDIVLREHFLEYRDLYHPEVTKSVVGFAFNRLIDYRYVGPNTSGISEAPRPYGPLIVVKRSEVGLPEIETRKSLAPASRFFAEFGVVANSLVAYAHHKGERLFPGNHHMWVDHGTQDFDMGVAFHIERQITS